MKKGYVTILTPCYNGENFISNLIDSILRQTYKKIQFILVNDGSTDATEEIALKYQEKIKIGGGTIDFKYLKQKNAGQAKAVNNGLKYVDGEYFIEADADDYFSDDAIENMVKFLDKHPDYSAVRGNARFFKLGKNNKEETIEIRKSKEPKNTDLFLNYILEKDTYCYPGVIMFRMGHFLEKNKDRNIYVNRFGQNWQLILPSVYQAKTGYIDKLIYNYFVREGSHSRQKSSFLFVLKRMNNHKKILTKTVKKIVDDSNEKKEYLNIIKNKYSKLEKEFIHYKIHHWND